VSAEIKKIPGIIRVEFDQKTLLFHVEFHKRFVSPDNIFTAIWQAGKDSGKEFVPEIVT
jgi:hypothetical protein